MKKSDFFPVFLLTCGLFPAGCYYQRPDYSDDWDLTERRKDSLDFEVSHHYNRNYNFVVAEDSLCLQTARPVHNPVNADVQGDTAVVYADDRLVVAEIMFVPEDSVDSVWVKVARDQYTMGWVHERDLLPRVVPDDPISQFIHAFSDTHLIYFLCALGASLTLWMLHRMRRKRYHLVHFDDIGSFYPTLLCLTLSGAATLYASMQNFVPGTWTEFYFHPTLNPFGLPFVLGLFVASVWLIVILAMASVEDVCRQLPFREAMLYLFGLSGVCAGCYLFFSLATLYYVGYPFFLAYVVWALRRYFHHARCPYVCGRCGAKLRAKGRCPRCGGWNE